MYKLSIRILSIFSIICILFCVSCGTNQSRSSNNVTYITKLDETFEGKYLKITATNIITYPSYDSSGSDLIVGVRFIIQNISDEDYSFNAKNISAHVDNVSAQFSTLYPLANSNESLWGVIMPEGYAKGYCYVNAPKGAKTVQIRITDDYFKRTFASFVFDIPDSPTQSNPNNTGHNDITDLLI